MKVIVDSALCIGCELCADTCPDVFRMDDDNIAYVIAANPAHELYGDVEGCAEMCPTNAISVAAD